MRSRGFEKVTVDRILTQPPVHIDGKGLRAYRSFELMAAKVSKEPRVSDAARSTNVSFGGDRRNCVFLEAPPKALQSVRGARYHGNPARMYAMIFQISSSVSASLKAGISVPKR